MQRFEIGLLLFWYNVLTTNRMNQGKFVFFQLLSLISHRSFLACVKRYKGDYKAKHFSCWKQFLCMAFGQLAHRESLSDTILCLSVNEQKLYHPGIGEAVAKSTLSKANENRDWRIYADLAMLLISEAKKLYINDSELEVSLSTMYLPLMLQRLICAYLLLLG